MCYLIIVCFFLFKQKTAYEMRISDWRSDVCSSDLGLTLDVQKGQTFDYKDDKKDKISLTAGTTSADGRSNIMAHFGYSKQGAVYGKRRPGNAVDNTPLIYTAAAQGLPSEVFKFVSPTLSSYTPEGTVFGSEEHT